MILAHLCSAAKSAMIDFHEKRKLKNILYSRVVLVLFLVPIVLVSMAAYDAFHAEREVRDRRVELASELVGLQARINTLEGNVTRLNEPRGMEEELRRRFDVGREGEQTIVLIEKTASATATSGNTPIAERSWWRKALDWL